MSKLVLLLIIASVNFAGEIDEPRYEGVSYAVVGDSIVQFEKQNAQEKARNTASSYIPYTGGLAGKSIVYLEFKNEKSNVRLNGNEVKIIARGKGQDIDPNKQFGLVKLETHKRKKIRYIELASSSAYAGRKNEEIAYIPFNSNAFGENSFELLVENLEPGEYAFINIGSGKLFNLFGVD